MVNPDRSCHWCGRRIRYAPIADQWWHLSTGAQQCGAYTVLAEHRAMPSWQKGYALAVTGPIPYPEPFYAYPPLALVAGIFTVCGLDTTSVLG